MRNILVLMSTYNGEKYLKEQIDSILAQKNVEVTIRVRDDGSTDGTIRILEEYQKCGKLNWYSSTNMGPAKSFLDLVYNAPLKYDYYAFCDQDDYWKEDKLYKAIERLEHFDDKPALYHCELEIVDENLEHIKMTRNCNKTKFIDQTLMVFYIPGCTMVFNNCLMRKIQERKPEFDLITMHDCWLYYICLGIGGKIISDKNAYIQYRQHGNNVIGAKRISIRKKIQMILKEIYKHSGKTKPRVQVIGLKAIKSAKLLDLSGDVKETNRFVEHLRFTVENDEGRTVQEYLLPNFVASCCKELGIDGIRYKSTGYKCCVLWKDDYFENVEGSREIIPY